MIAVSARVLDSLLHDWRGRTPSEVGDPGPGAERSPRSGPGAERATSVPAPAYLALADRIRLLIVDGRISVGARLPAERELAKRLGVSRTTVSAAYAELRASAHLVSARGSGSTTRMPGRAPVSLNYPSPGFLDFSKAALPASTLLAAAAVRAAQVLPAYLGEPGFDPIGLPRLREAIAERYRARGLPTLAEQVMVTVGAQHAIALLSRVLLGRGDSALVESPSYPHAFDALRAAGARLVPVSVTTDDGWDDDALEQSLRRSSPAVGYVMPDFHNPTGRVMPVEQRERMLHLASREGTVIIADETMAELDIDAPDRPLPLAAYGPAVLVGSLGKTVWGGVRIGWIRAEPALIQKLVRARSALDLGTPILEQLIATDLLGRFDGILAERRDHLRRGRDHLERVLRDAIPEWHVPRVSGGLTVWANLGLPVSSQLTLAARNEGLLLAAGPRFGIDGAFERFLRLPFSYSIGETDAAVSALARAWNSLSRHPLADQSYLAAVV